MVANQNCIAFGMTTLQVGHMSGPSYNKARAGWPAGWQADWLAGWQAGWLELRKYDTVIKQHVEIADRSLNKCHGAA